MSGRRVPQERRSVCRRSGLTPRRGNDQSDEDEKDRWPERDHPEDDVAVAKAGEKVCQQGERAVVDFGSAAVGTQDPPADHPGQNGDHDQPDEQRKPEVDQLAARAGLGGERAAGACQRFEQRGISFKGQVDPRAMPEGGHNSAVMKKIRAAVIGVGYLGRFHAQKYAQIPGCELVAVVDSRQETRDKVAAEVGARAVGDYRELLGTLDAISVVTPTPAHFAIARDFLSAGTHVLVEKPITETASEARELINLAVRQKCVLQVGHLERFNATILAAEPYLRIPRFIECHRLAPYKERGTDVNVVLDLMIHDIDIVQTIVGASIAAIDAVGTPVFSDEIDIANARIRFENGCVANATASRVSMKTERKMRIIQDDAYLSLDLQQKILTLIRKRPGGQIPGQLPVTIEEQSFEQGDALKAEIESFLGCIRTLQPPVVSGEAGLRALETATRITAQVHEYLAERRPSERGASPHA